MNTIHPCRCCLLRPPDKNLKKPYTRFGKTEIYSDMIKECFEIQLTLDNDNACGICEVCVSRLRDASDFKLQVQRSQAELQAQLEVAVEFKAEPSIKTEIDNVKSDDDTDDFSSERAVETETGDMNVEAEYLFIELTEAASDSCKLELPELSVSESQLAMGAASVERRHGDQAMHYMSHETCHPEAGLSAAMTVTDCNDSQQGKPDNILDVPVKKDTFKYDICGKQFANKSQSIKHLKDRTGQQTVSRKTCTKKIHNKDIFNQCTTSHTGQITYKCNVCEQQTTSKMGLNSHMRVHTKRDKLQPDSRQLIHTSIQTHTCEICDKQFKNKYTLKYHQKLHTKEKPLVDLHTHKEIRADELHCCDICGNQFRKKFNLIRHIKRHVEKKLLQCHVCQKQFRKKDSLTKHIGVHMGLKPYGCQICGQKYDHAKSLRRHKRIHTREKPYPCEICHKRFGEKHHLKVHIRIHTGEKPYCCEVCGRKFSRHTNFSRHLQIHVKGYTFSCELCPKFYSTKEGLRQHRRVHLGKISSQKKVKNTETITTDQPL